jgi:hypothetical protein
MACPNCSGETRETDRYCSNCGIKLPEKPQGESQAPKTIFGLSVLTLTCLGSLVLSVLLSALFGFPVFLLAGFLPLLWQRRGR